jgi:hypothetical protein
MDSPFFGAISETGANGKEFSFAVIDLCPIDFGISDIGPKVRVDPSPPFVGDSIAKNSFYFKGVPGPNIQLRFFESLKIVDVHVVADLAFPEKLCKG